MKEVEIYEEIIHKDNPPTYMCIELLEYFSYVDYDYIKYKYEKVFISNVSK